jgi:hypothetical protein
MGNHVRIPLEEPPLPRFDDVLSGRAPLNRAAPQDLLAASAYALARERFFRFRQLIHPGMIWNWWTREVSDHLEQFYYDMLDGLRPRLALMSPPPRSGLSWMTAASRNCSRRRAITPSS